MMFALIPVLLRSAAAFAFSGAAVIASLGFFKRPVETKSVSPSYFEIAKIAVYGLTALAVIKLAKGALL